MSILIYNKIYVLFKADKADFIKAYIMFKVHIIIQKSICLAISI